MSSVGAPRCVESGWRRGGTCPDLGELVLHFQLRRPSGTVTSVEALVRWQHPTRGLLPPDMFLPVAEQTGLIHPLTEWVLDAALAQLHRFTDLAPDLVVAVNIS